jgi:hypothetical protein
MNEIIGAMLFGLFIMSSCLLFFFLLRSSRYVKHALLAVTGSIMIAHASRMISQGLFSPGSYYVPGLFDLLFDWFTLLFLGGFVAWYGFTQFYRENNGK